MHQAKVEKSALYLILPMILELKRLGFANVRFYSYMRWTLSLVVVLYQEMSFKARTGEALVYPRLFSCEYQADMAPKDREKCDSGLNLWSGNGMSVQEVAASFSEHYLKSQLPAAGCYSDEYYPWIESVIAACPPQAFPVTEEPIPGGPYAFDGTIQFFGAKAALQRANIPRPPGLNKMLEPYGEMTSAIARDTVRTKAIEPNGFQKWCRKANGI